MKLRSMLLVTATATAGASLAAPNLAAAQAYAGEGAAAVQEVVVTARRREENVQDVPLAVSALNPIALQRQNVVNIEAMNGKFAGLVVSQNPNGSGAQAPFFSIRGQSQQEVVGLVDPSVSLYVDDVIVPRSNGANLGFFDLAGVEVARGPQGTLFGRNTTGGAVLIRTQRPTKDFSAYVSGMAGNYGAFTGEAMLNIPLGSMAALRVAGQHVERNGYIKDVVLNNKDINTLNDDAFRISLVVNAERWSNFLSGSWARGDDGGTGGFVVFSPSALYAPNAADPLGPLGRQAALNSVYRTYSGVPQFSKVWNWGLSDELTFDLNENFRIKNIAAIRGMRTHSLEDLDGTDRRIFPVERIIGQHQFSEELQLQGKLDKLDFVTGLYYFREHVDDQALSAGALTAGAAFYGPDPLIEPATLLAYDPNYSNTWGLANNKSYAVYGQGDYKFTDQWTLTVGLRYNIDKRVAIVRNRAFQPTISTAALTCRFTLDTDNNPATPEVRPPLDACQFVGRHTFKEPTYNISLSYRATPDMLLYVAHRHGYRSGGFGARASTQATLSQIFKPEIVNDAEGGIKADWRPGGMFLRTNLAVYYSWYKNAQRFLQVSQAPPITAAANAQKARIYGTELEVLFRPTHLLELSGFWAYTNGKFIKFTTPLGVDLSPQPFPHSPKNIYSITARVFVPVPEKVGKVSFAANFYHQDKEDINDAYASPILTDAGVPQTPAGAALARLVNANQILAGHSLLNFDVEWREVLGSRLDLSAFVQNATNNQYLLPYFSVVNVLEARTPGPPRMFGVKARYTFD